MIKTTLVLVALFIGYTLSIPITLVRLAYVASSATLEKIEEEL